MATVLDPGTVVPRPDFAYPPREGFFGGNLSGRCR